MLRECSLLILPFIFSHSICMMKRPKLSSVQSLSSVRVFVTPWTAAHQASLSITNSPEFTQTHVR